MPFLPPNQQRQSTEGTIFGTTRLIFTKSFVQQYALPTAAARFSSGGIVICYALPVLWMMSQAKVARRHCPAKAQCTCSLGLGYKLCAVIPVAGQRTHRTTFRALKVISQLATPGAESAVCDCLLAKVLKFKPKTEAETNLQNHGQQ